MLGAHHDPDYGEKPRSGRDRVIRCIPLFCEKQKMGCRSYHLSLRPLVAELGGLRPVADGGMRILYGQ